MTLNHIDMSITAHPAIPHTHAAYSKAEQALEDIVKLLAGYDVISFDVFETLLERTGVFRPIDLFLEIGAKAEPLFGVSPETFAQLRIRAEREARALLAGQHGRDVHIKQIYARLGALLTTVGAACVPASVLRDAAEMEMDVELSHLRPVASVAAVYRWAIQSGKTVIFVSDFYSPAGFVEKALRQNKFAQYDHLFVSCELDHTKHAGDLYHYVCQHLDVEPQQIVHLGDNAWSDGARALQAGIAHIRINNPVNPLLARLGLDWRSPTASPASVLFAEQARRGYGSGIVVRRPEDEPVLERVGREALAPLLLGMSGWLYEEAGRLKLPGLYFCSRDGLVMKQAFDLYQAKFGQRTQSRYLRISRQVIYRASAVVEPGSAEGLFTQNWSRLTPGDALTRWGLDPAAFADRVRDVGFSSIADMATVGDQVGDRRFAALYQACRDELQAVNKKHADAFFAYLAHEGVTNEEKVTLVDIGWHGSLQKGLERLLAARGWRGRMAGRYLGLFLDEERLKGFDAAGYLFSKDKTPIASALRKSPSLVELLHTAGHGSTAGYQVVGDGVRVEEESRPDEAAQYATAIHTIQASALAFITDMIADRKWRSGQISPEDAFSGLKRLLHFPTPDEVHAIGRLRIAANYGSTATTVALTDISSEGYSLWNVS